MLVAEVFRWLCWTWLAAELVMAILVRTRRSGGKSLDRGSQLLLWLAIFVAFAGSDWVRKLAPWNIGVSIQWLAPLSLVVLVAGLAIRTVAIVTLRKWFSMNVAIRDAQRVHRSGLYRVVRHPSYLGMEIAFLAIGMISGNWACLAWIVGVPMLAFLYRIHVEETALHEAFGEEYAAYSRVTKRLIPGVY